MSDADRIKQLEVALRRAIHAIKVLRPLAVWPVPETWEGEDPYDDEWAVIALVLIEDALKGGDE